MKPERLRFAYNTNGLQSHRLEDALDLIAGAGYQGVSLTLDHMHLDPLTATSGETRRVARAIRSRGLECAVETGARFLLDGKRKHRPTLIEADALGRAKRLWALIRMIDVAAELEATSVTFASGPRDPGVPESVALAFLEDALRALAERAESSKLALALEPEPGHLPATLSCWKKARERVPVKLALDVTHLSVEEAEPSPGEAVREYASELAVVHVADSPRGKHEHMLLGEGDLDLPALLRALGEVDFPGLVSVELSRHSHAAHEVVPGTLAALREAARKASS